MSPNLKVKGVIQGAPHPRCQDDPQQKYISLEIWEPGGEVILDKAPGGMKEPEMFLPPLTPETLLLFCLSLQNKESLIRL